MDRKSSVLVVDDDRQIANMLKLRLSAAGYDVETAHDGAAGLIAISKRSPDAVILDISMPVLDGLGVLAALQTEDGVAPPVIVLSASVADRFLRPEEPVLGVVGADGTAKCYSTWQLEAHEIVNDELDGLPIAATW